MTTASWISPELMRPAGWALLHFLWQGTALAALAAVAMSFLRRASARYLAGVCLLIAVLVAPIVTFSYYRTYPRVDRWREFTPAPGTQAQVTIWKQTTAVSFASPRMASDLFPWIVQVWLGGVVFFSLRSAGGFVLLERMRRRQTLQISGRLQDICLDLQSRLGIRRAIRYCRCVWLEAPAVIGCFRPIVFLPMSALTGLSEAQLQAVIAHELAHIKRFDSFINGFQVVVETLLFYHPAVWWLNKRIRMERENCCDDIAIAVCGNAVEYARALTQMEQWRVAPAMAMAANRGPLSARITRLLGIRDIRANLRTLGLTAGVLSLSVGLIAADAMLGLTEKVRAQATTTTAAPAAPATRSNPPAKPSPSSKPAPARQAEAAGPSARTGSYIEEMKAAGIGDISVDELVAFKVQGITPEYVQKMKQLGVRMEPDTLVGMKVQGVTPEYISGLREDGVNVNDEQIIGMKVQGITADYVRAMHQEGIQADADELIGMKVQGVTPEYVRGFKEQGFHPDADKLIGMKVQGVTPEYIRDVRALGLRPTADEIIGMKVQGVTPEYIKALQSAGFKFDADEFIGAKVQGITPEFIDMAKKHGFQNLTLDKLIQLKHLGVLDKEGEI